MLYTSVTNLKIKNLSKLKTKKEREKANLFLVEGRHLTLEAYKAGYLKELLITEDQDFSLDVSTNYISKSVLKYLSSVDSPTGICHICLKKEEEKNGIKRR